MHNTSLRLNGGADGQVTGWPELNSGHRPCIVNDRGIDDRLQFRRLLPSQILGGHCRDKRKKSKPNIIVGRQKRKTKNKKKYFILDDPYSYSQILNNIYASLSYSTLYI
jgi:hypothetical protein